VSTWISCATWRNADLAMLEVLGTARGGDLIILITSYHSDGSDREIRPANELTHEPEECTLTNNLLTQTRCARKEG
jgi:hypothetical protein